MTLYAIHLWIALLICLPLLLLVKKKLAAQRQNKQLHPPPSPPKPPIIGNFPPKLPIIGNLHQLGELCHQSLWRLFKKYGPVILIKLGRISNIVISSAEAVREVLKVHDLDCCSRPPLNTNRRLTYNYQDIAFAPYGQYWREILWPILERDKENMEEEVDMLINSIWKSSSSATFVDLSEKLFTLTANVTFRIAFGKSFRGSDLDNERFQEVIHEAMAMLGSFNASEYVPYVGWIVIDLHLKPDRPKLEHEDIVDVLLKIEREQTKADNTHFSKANIKAILLNLYLAGVDTELIRSPKVMKQAQDEVRKIVGNKGRFIEIDMDHLPYIKMIMKETFRLHPPSALLLPRQTTVPFKLNGYDINPQSIIQNPEEFTLERFVDSSVEYKGQNFEFLPFGAGRRGCPGVYMATSTIELALANLLYCFDWKLLPGMKEKDINMQESLGFSLTTSKKTALNLVPVKLF
ncbi:hypothetical protein I3760_06G074100 [Carya illinoinensis]|nr:hypothetical protein I3760_06G074100 [Carya illinoinensis]